MEKECITVVIEYDESDEQPVFTAGMSVLGGQIIAVQFNDALKENEELEQEKLELERISLDGF